MAIKGRSIVGILKCAIYNQKSLESLEAGQGVNLHERVAFAVLWSLIG